MKLLITHLSVFVLALVLGAFGAATAYVKEVAELREELVARHDVSYECVIRLSQTERILDAAVAQLQESHSEMEQCYSKLKICLGVR